jgi:hypothetical protein
MRGVGKGIGERGKAGRIETRGAGEGNGLTIIFFEKIPLAQFCAIGG